MIDIAAHDKLWDHVYDALCLVEKDITLTRKKKDAIEALLRECLDLLEDE